MLSRGIGLNGGKKPRLAAVTALTGAFVVGPALFNAGLVRADLSDVECNTPEQVCVVTTLGLPLRLLTKPQSNIYIQPDETSAQLHGNVEAFKPYYAFEAIDVEFTNELDATGWFRVGPTFQAPEGYMRAQDVVIWKQALAVTFTNPGPSERKPVLMFDNVQSLETTVAEASNDPQVAEDLYQRVLSSDVPPEIKSREPNGWVDVEKSFYLMPIVSYRDLSLFWPGGDLKAVQVAAVTNAARSQQQDACNLRNSDGNECIQRQSGGGAGSLGLDAVFVIDTTSSMQPHIDAVRNAVRDAARSLSANATSADTLKLGLVGYRDDPDSSPGLEYAARNFTSETLLDADGFIEMISDGTVKAASVGSGDYTEDVFAGLKAAIDATPWTPDHGRVIILIGDASAHGTESQKNSTGLDERSIKALASEKNVYIAALYIGSETDSDYTIARPQYETVAAGDGESAIAFARVDPQGSEGGLELALRDSIDKIVGLVANSDFAGIMSGSTDAGDAAGQAIVGAVRAAVVDYIGKDAVPPSNMVVWALDRDPSNFRKKAFDIRVVVTRNDLIDMMELLKTLLADLDDEQVGGGFVFMGAQQQSGSTSVDLGIAEAQAINESEMTPKWAKALPYRSELLSMTLEEFNQMPADSRASFEKRLNALVSFYDTILNKPEAWIVLNEQAGPEEKAYLLDLANLP